MIVRWLGAFNKASSYDGVYDSIAWELKGKKKLVCAEKLIQGRSCIRAKVGLLVKNRAIVRKFRSDVYSQYTESGNLRPTRSQYSKGFGHTECFVRPDFIGIVVKRGVSDWAWTQVEKSASLFDLPVFRLTRNGELIQVREKRSIMR